MVPSVVRVGHFDAMRRGPALHLGLETVLSVRFAAPAASIDGDDASLAGQRRGTCEGFVLQVR